jgi:hypothetical protein
MSAAVMAPRAPRRRTLERMGMTPEQELELLIREQEADDTFYVDRPSHIISIDAPSPTGEGTLADLIGYDPETGEQLVCFPLPATPPLANASQHGTEYAYNRLGCKCAPCREAAASGRRARRARKSS